MRPAAMPRVAYPANPFQERFSSSISTTSAWLVL